jgi:hypothetical protein
VLLSFKFQVSGCKFETEQSGHRWRFGVSGY